MFPKSERRRLAFRDSVARANLCAAAAVDAGVRVDVVDIALCDGVCGAYALASATCDAVVANYISHNCNSFKGLFLDNYYLVDFAMQI